MRDAVTLIVEVAFAVVFARALLEYLRSRDPLHRDVVLVFSAMAVIFGLELVRRLVGPPPAWLSGASSVLLLAQPYLTLRLVARLRPVPGWLRWSALGALVVTAAPVLPGRPLPPVLVLAAVAAFVGVEAAAAGYLFAEARRRSGSPRVRLLAVATATAAFALAILAAGAGSAGGPASRQLASDVALAVAYASGLGYLVAFAPPAWLRRWWSASAAYTVTRQLLYAPASEGAAQTWQHYAETVCRVTGADAAAVLLGEPGRSAREIAFARGPIDLAARHPVAAVDGLLAGGRPITVPTPPHGDAAAVAGAGTPTRGRRSAGAPGLARDLAGRVAATYVTAVPLGSGAGARGALVLLNTHRRLFSDDDVALLGELGEQAVVLAERGSLLTEKERLNAELAASVDALSLASKAKSDFLAGMSHELRTPLNAIIGFADLMGAADSLGDDERVVPAEWIRHVRSGGGHLLDLINDILDLAKVEAGRIDLKLELLPLPAIIAEVVTTLRVVSDRKQLSITTDVPVTSVQADRIRLRQVLDNLLSNAIKFTPAGGDIRVSAEYTETEVRLTVADSGVGISVEDQKKVFDEFTQVGDATARRAGTGLGLALTRRLVEAHGGTIELQSEPGVGSRFTVCLPRVAGDALAVAVDGEPAPAAGGVLVIEDDPAAANLLTAHLADLGYPVLVATTGAQGLRHARRCRPAAIVLDVLLPDVDGWQVLRELKLDPATRDIPVIVSTVLDEHEVGLALGAVDYLAKPVDPTALLALLGRHALLPSPSGPANVLTIDDDPGTLELVSEVLSGHGARAVTASSGQAGLELARSDPHDLIICDLGLPDIDAFTLISALNHDPATAGTPIVVLAADDVSRANAGWLAGGVVDVVARGDRARDRLSEWLVRLGVPETAALPGAGPPAGRESAPARVAAPP